MLMIMHRRKEKQKEIKFTHTKKTSGLARQASKQTCSLSELEGGPPPRPSHLQVEGEKTILLSAWLFSGTLASLLLPYQSTQEIIYYSNLAYPDYFIFLVKQDKALATLSFSLFCFKRSESSMLYFV